MTNEELDFDDLVDLGILTERDACNRSSFLGDYSECHEYVKIPDGRIAYICTYRLDMNYGPDWRTKLSLEY